MPPRQHKSITVDPSRGRTVVSPPRRDLSGDGWVLEIQPVGSAPGDPPKLMKYPTRPEALAARRALQQAEMLLVAPARLCKQTFVNGRPCGRPAKFESEFCENHQPVADEEEEEGRPTPQTEHALIQALAETAELVRRGKINEGRAHMMMRLYTAQLKHLKETAKSSADDLTDAELIDEALGHVARWFRIQNLDRMRDMLKEMGDVQEQEEGQEEEVMEAVG